jgi:fatty-acyl-CoA synthase
MATLLLRPGATFDPAGFVEFLAGQSDLGTKGSPRYVRITDELPVTATTKVLKRVLRNEGWRCAEEVWWQPDRDAPYRLLLDSDAEELDKAIASR